MSTVLRLSGESEMCEKQAGLTEFQKIQAKEIARLVVEEMKCSFVTKRQLYLWALTACLAVSIFLYENPHIIHNVLAK